MVREWPQPAALGKQGDPLSRPFAKKKILVIDDSEIVLGLVRATLEGAGFQVITQSRTAGTIALVLQEKPDLVLLDVNMPTITGDKLAKLFGKAQGNSDTIVLLHSSLPEAVLKARTMGAGAHGYIQKTDDAYQLIREVNRWLRTNAQAGDGRPQAAAPRQEGAWSHPPSGARLAAVKGRNDADAEPDDAPAALAQSGRMVAAAVRGEVPLVLFIDHDMSALSTFRREVQAEPYGAEFALSGSQALRRIASATRPHVVVLDLSIPEPSGPEVYRKALEVDPGYRDRIILIVEQPVVGGLAQFLAAFRGAVLNKPVQGAALRSAIRAGLSYGARTNAV